jgi:hypothetical protein
VKKIALVLSLGLLALTACGGGEQQQQQQAPAINYPEWVMKGSGAFGGDQGRVFYGVGAAGMIKNPALLRTTADNRARNEVAKIFKVYSASLMKDYMASTTDGSAASEEQHVENAIKTFTATTLSGVEIVDHWIHPNDGTMYSLAALNMKAFMDAAEKVNELSEKAKEYIKKNAEKSHMDLESEEAKQRDANGGQGAVGNAD